MTSRNPQFQAFLKEEIQKSKGIAVPVRAGTLRRALIRKLPCRRLHPNLADEFCDPDIGPNEKIISGYAEEYWRVLDDSMSLSFRQTGASEPLIVQRLRPEGYMILNGHHRWAAALQVGLRKLPVRIADLTRNEDVLQMMRNTRYQKRVTLDLDEVIFCRDENTPSEKTRHFLFRKIYREPIRRGIPALFHSLYFQSGGYDIWVYSGGYYSMDYLRRLFRMYHFRVTGIVTGMDRKGSRGAERKEEIERLMAEKYEVTVHVDQKSVFRVDSRTKQFDECRLSGNPETWSSEVLDAIGRMDRTE